MTCAGSPLTSEILIFAPGPNTSCCPSRRNRWVTSTRLVQVLDGGEPGTPCVATVCWTLGCAATCETSNSYCLSRAANFLVASSSEGGGICGSLCLNLNASSLL